MKLAALSKEMHYLEFERKWDQTGTCTSWWGKGIPRKEALYKSHFARCYIILAIKSNSLDCLNRDGVTDTWFPFYEMSKTRRILETESRVVVARDYGKNGGIVGDDLMVIGFLFWADKMLWNWTVVMVAQYHESTVSHWTVHLKMAKWWVFYEFYSCFFFKKYGVLRWHILFCACMCLIA